MNRDTKSKHSDKSALTVLLTVALLITGSSSAYSAIYKWQDENGGWHFSEVPPDNKQAQKVDVRVTPPSGNESDHQGETETLVDQSTRESSPEEDKPLAKSKEVAAEDRARRKKNCQIARENLANLQRGRIRFLDEKSGEERYLSEEERLQRIKDNKKIEAENCH
ncbi:MAG: DUF4124 domain-containing protein [Porticoccaceae bacterium]|nr:DUF4124 domain-containing protein [Pseudomonadales bacterium]MCP5172494.1 DUF4124 domain-containing protein [Pseudomonadales bacterium]